MMKDDKKYCCECIHFVLEPVSSCDYVIKDSVRNKYNNEIEQDKIVNTLEANKNGDCPYFNDGISEIKKHF